MPASATWSPANQMSWSWARSPAGSILSSEPTTEGPHQGTESAGRARYFRLLDSLDIAAGGPPLSPLASKPARKVIPGWSERDVKRLRAAVRDAKELRPEPATIRPCTRHGKTANGCATPPKPRRHRPEEGRAPRGCRPKCPEDPGRPSGQRRHPGAAAQARSRGLRSRRKRVQLWAASRAGASRCPRKPKPASTAYGRSSRPLPCRGRFRVEAGKPRCRHGCFSARLGGFNKQLRPFFDVLLCRCCCSPCGSRGQTTCREAFLGVCLARRLQVGLVWSGHLERLLQSLNTT